MKETTVPQKNTAQAPDTREEAHTLTPPVDIFETEAGLGVIVDLPGVKKEDLDIRVENDVLTIAGNAHTQMPGTPVYREFEITRYYRQFQLSDHVDQERIKAELHHGVLSLQLPKSEKAKPKKIAVSVNA